ncbi:GFA family protein [Mesorhizobium retamae]|uniref:GFA family protein n=1 Tax=Mesorhizobium retamae TaxID=2912854 RepID=A0ABS9QPH1_9HYPH|nr:GFA family protein [Mesorhizobium sp. IRAMC:0171]MCG7509220.1 GFA family protein [Mesorhizobium sp. IRAMC:0171]
MCPTKSSVPARKGAQRSSAQCACGGLRVTLLEPPQLTALCHCFACQRRTGAPFSANAFYALDCVEVSGEPREFVRTAESGRKVRMYFCPTCGSTLYWKAEASPETVGVAVGAFADPAFAPPALSVFEKSKHDWVQLDETVQPFEGLPTGRS